jgi:ferredoxin
VDRRPDSRRPARDRTGGAARHARAQGGDPRRGRDVRAGQDAVVPQGISIPPHGEAVLLRAERGDPQSHRPAGDEGAASALRGSPLRRCRSGQARRHPLAGSLLCASSRAHHCRRPCLFPGRARVLLHRGRRSPAGEEGVDVLAAPIGEDWIVRPITPKGDALVADHCGAWKPASAADWASAQEAARKAGESIERREIPAAWAGPLEQSFDDPKWNSMAARCVGCSICAYVCPSCSCFDVSDRGPTPAHALPHLGQLLRLFTQHGSGHNPRADQPRAPASGYSRLPISAARQAMCVARAVASSCAWWAWTSRKVRRDVRNPRQEVR